MFWRKQSPTQRSKTPSRLGLSDTPDRPNGLDSIDSSASGFEASNPDGVVDAMRKRAQSVPEEKPKAPANVSPRVIESMAAVPTYMSVLTGPEAKGGMRVPLEFQYSVVAIELGPRRAMLLFDHTATAQIKRLVAQVRATLLTLEYTLEHGEQPCAPSVLTAIVENSRGKNQVVNEGASLSQGRMLWEGWVDLAVREHATDLHIEIIGNSAQVRVRIDGEVHMLPDDQQGVYTAAQAENAMSWAYNIASGKGSNSNSSFTRSAYLYTMIQPRDIDGKKIALRYQSARGWQGPKVVARILNVDANVPTLTFDELGYEHSQCVLFDLAARRPSGLVLIAGVTGSGKTTTLKSFIETHPGNGSSAFYSVEDPVEYPLRGVHQISLQRDISNESEAMSQYQEVVSAMMRMDPDAALLGEIRDRATAAAGQQMVETGHMAAGTVHAHLLSGIVPRLTNQQIGMDREILTGPNMITLLVYQALVPLLCDCSIRGRSYPKNLPDSTQTHRLLDTIERRFEFSAERFRFRRPGGCQRCRRRGTSGLTVVAEMLSPDRTWLELTRAKRDFDAMLYYRSQSDGRFDLPNMTGKTVFEHALYKAQRSQIDVRQCERFDSFDTFELHPKGPNL